MSGQNVISQKKQLQDVKVKWIFFFLISASCGELLGTDGEAIEFEWNIFPGFTSLQILQEIPNDLQKRNVEPEKFADRIIFMSVFNDTDWTGNYRRDTGRPSVLETKRNGMENRSTLLKESGIQQRLIWYSDSRKQVTQSLKVPVC